jgi:uncharacterized protein involved in exopolysaccharide biosynthesis
MIGKILETVFQHKLLLLLPPVLIPLIVGPIALVTAPVFYEAYVGVWVDRPAYLNTNASDWNNYLSPAQNQSNRLGELLRTRQFLVDVVGRTSLANVVGNDRGEQRVRDMLASDLGIFPSNNHLLVMRFRAQSPQLAHQMLNAVVDAFKEKSATDRIDQANLASGFYENQLQTAQADLAKASGELRRYVTANPHLTDPEGPDSRRVAVAGIDPQLAELQRRVTNAQQALERATGSLDQAQLNAAAALEGQELGFQVIDPAKQPTQPSRELRKRIIYPLAGLLVGMAFSGAVLVLLLATDRTVRNEADLGSSVRVVGVLPQLKFKRLPKRSGPDIARRAIGFVAGTALPAPREAKS